MDRRKKLLLLILEKLTPYRELAEGFLLLVQESEDQEFISQLYSLLISQIKAIKSCETKEALKTAIQKLKEKEKALQKKENEEADKLFNDLLDTIEE